VASGGAAELDRATEPASARLQLVEKMQTESVARMTMAATCIGLLLRFPLAIFGVQARRTVTGRRTGHSTQRSPMIYRKGIGRICGALLHAGESDGTDD
jgi:hypothetical protein